MPFKKVDSQVNFVALENELLKEWYESGLVEKYLHRNDKSEEKFSFLDGPITANNPMGVHHGWGRTYKDLWQRYFNMRGRKQRFQNGFDEQGLWVEVEVEKELGLKSKKEIENLIPGDIFASLEKFVNLCKERVKKYSAIQSEQSKRLGYFMDWENSYHTSSDENNYWIWHFLKTVHNKGWLYKGHDSVPWCPRCGTAISQHEILTEEYKELTHTAIYFQLPVRGKAKTFILIWTTTPWTIPANVAVAIDPQLSYSEVFIEDVKLIVATQAAKRLFPDAKLGSSYKGSELVHWEYDGPFDHLVAVKEAFGSYVHRVIASDPLIMPISTEEGTGLVHIAPGAGAEDFQLGQKEKLPVVAPIDESAVIVEGFGELTGLNVTQVIVPIVDYLKENDFLYKAEEYTHRYPTCWRCKSELVWRVVDEWYIAMDKADDSGKTYREQMIEVAKKINWIPDWGLDRELDWLKNMHDWLISKKRYWGLALPIWECSKCGNFEVIDGKEELKARAAEGWGEFEGHTPHKPWIDQIKIKCLKCDEVIERIPDVGNPWLDAGIVPFSTLPEDWRPADFVTESFPGQFKNWFYSLIAMSTALKKEVPTKNLLGFATMVDEKGEAFHKSAGNSIEFVEGADKAGADIIRWMCATHSPENNLLFGFNNSNEVKRRFYLILWNCYKFFVDYASLANWSCDVDGDVRDRLTILDSWVLSKLTRVVLLTNESLVKFDSSVAGRAVEEFVVNDLSTWYIRRSRDRVGPGADKEDEKVFLATLYGVLVTLSKLLAPFMPFICETIFRNLTDEESVHIQDYPLGDKSLLDEELAGQMQLVREVVERGHALRKEAQIKLRQPLASLAYTFNSKLSDVLEKIVADELNVKKVEYNKSSDDELKIKLDTKITPSLQAEGEVRDLIRQIQSLRKDKGLTLVDKVKVTVPKLPDAKFIELIKRQTNAQELSEGVAVEIEVVNAS